MNEDDPIAWYGKEFLNRQGGPRLWVFLLRCPLDILQCQSQRLKHGIQFLKVLFQGFEETSRQEKSMEGSLGSDLLIIVLDFMQKGSGRVEKTFKSFNQGFDSVDIHHGFLREKESPSPIRQGCLGRQK